MDPTIPLTAGLVATVTFCLLAILALRRADRALVGSMRRLDAALRQIGR